MAGKQTTITRTMSEAEMAALIKRQHLLQQQKAAVAAAQQASVVSGVSGQVAQVQLPGQSTLASSPSVSPQLMPQTVQVSSSEIYQLARNKSFKSSSILKLKTKFSYNLLHSNIYYLIIIDNFCTLIL